MGKQNLKDRLDDVTVNLLCAVIEGVGLTEEQWDRVDDVVARWEEEQLEEQRKEKAEARPDHYGHIVCASSLTGIVQHAI